jgi:hypothetical protein
MPLLVLFVFGSVVMVAGAMLAPAWPTAQPRIALNATLALGVVLGGAIFWAMLFGWNTLVIDYLLFALITVIFLGGTLSYGQRRAEKRGGELLDRDQGWPGPGDLAFFGLVAFIFALPALILPVPLGTDAQGFGYLGLMVKLGGGFRTLTPWQPEVEYLYAPAFPLLIAYLSQQLGQGLHTVQVAVGGVLSLLLVWLAYDFGSEVKGKPLGRAMAVAMLVGTGLFSAFMDSHLTTLLGMVFALACLTYIVRYLRDHLIVDLVAAGLMLGALVLAHPDTTIIFGLGLGPWLLLMWLAQPRPSLRHWLTLVIAMPVIAVLAIFPWLLNIRDLLGANIVSPFDRNPAYWQIMILYHGVLIVPVAVAGAVIGLRRRESLAILAVVWWLMALEFSSLGIVEALIPGSEAWLLRYDYPFSIAWHGPIIPYTILGGLTIYWAWERWGAARLGDRLHRHSWKLLLVACLLPMLVLVFNRELLAFSKVRIGIFGTFSSAADVQAMEWLKHNTPPDARVLNFPGSQFDNSHEADWVPVISERESVYFRWQPFFRGMEPVLAEQDALRAFWFNPADPAHQALLRDANIGYVIVPQLVTDPASMETMFRWRTPFTGLIEMQSSVADAPYLELVADFDGAEVYAVREAD